MNYLLLVLFQRRFSSALHNKRRATLSSRSR